MATNSASATANSKAPAQVSPQRSPHFVQFAWLNDAVGKDIRVRLLDGKMIAGELMEFDQFSLSVWPAGTAVPLLLYKHAIAYLGAGEPEPKAARE